MRIAFVSDIHANLQAWNAVHADLVAQKVGRIICLGDIVGYGPSPAEVLTKVYANVHHFVLGNHDAVVSGSMQPTGFNPYAKQLIDRTCEKLGRRAKTFFRKIPLSIKSNDFRCAHGHPSNPSTFAYVWGEGEARIAWERISETLSFVGHTHRPCLHVLSEDGKYRKMQPGGNAITLQPGHRYIINCGSVGMSRDADFRGSYVIYDTEKRCLQWQRVAYDLEAFTKQVREEHGNTELTEFLLKRFAGTEKEAVRELIDFTPGKATVSRTVMRERELAQIKARVVRWKIAAAVVGLLLLLGAVGFWGFWRSLPQPLTLVADRQGVLSAKPGARAVSHQCIPKAAYDPNRLPPGWRAILEDARTQSVHFNGKALVLSSKDTNQELEIALPRLELTRVEKVVIDLHGKIAGELPKEPPLLVVDYVYKDGSTKRGAENERVRVEGKVLTKGHTVRDLSGEVRGLQIRLRACFRGELELDRLSLTAHPKPQPLKAMKPINVNVATAKELQALPEIGEVLAERIVAYREANGPFGAVEDLLKVKGIGKGKFAKFRKYVCTDD